ncbi:hypothetical protein FRB99_004205 [Tulasnella sp. 403]|nr:hypothetical protein FRB99_004205 [Tulasnella sp. 403]
MSLLRQSSYCIRKSSATRLQSRLSAPISIRTYTSPRDNTPVPPIPAPDTRPSKPQVDEEDDAFSPHENYVKPTLHVFSVFRKIFVYSSAVSLSLAGLALLGFEGAHLWVENVSIAAPSNPSADEKLWGWDVDQHECWTGGDKGGTDPTLGFKARHLLRAAWMAQHWGIGSQTLVGSEGVPRASDNTIAADKLSEQFLAHVLLLLKDNPKIPFPPASGTPLPNTVKDVLTQHARILERAGTRESVTAAREEYLILWHALSSHVATHVEAARVAVKLGDLSNRLQDNDTAVDWWIRAVDYVTLGETQAARQNSPPATVVPPALPPSPLAQRITLSALVSLSAHYAMTRQFDNALAVEQAALRMLSASSTTQRHSTSLFDVNPALPITSQNAPSILHSLFLQHRASVLSVHLAEVLYATSQQRSSLGKRKSKEQDGAAASHIHLHLAASTSEKIAHTLTDVTEHYSGVPSAITHTLSPGYAKNPILARPARNLLRDARRAAAEAWNLSGMLHELGGKKEDLANALECFERAVHWSGGQNAMKDADTEIVQKEWETYWRNYSRVKERLSR